MTRSACFITVLFATMSVSCAAAMDPGVALSSGRLPSGALPDVPRQRVEAADALTLDVYPRILWDQGDLSVQLRVEPDERSRILDVEWWSDEGGGGAHRITLEGERAAIRHQYSIKRLAAGEYEVAAILLRNDGTRVRRTATIYVTGR
jgi:hypothetical protein